MYRTGSTSLIVFDDSAALGMSLRWLFVFSLWPGVLLICLHLSRTEGKCQMLNLDFSKSHNSTSGKIFGGEYIMVQLYKIFSFDFMDYSH